MFRPYQFTSTTQLEKLLDGTSESFNKLHVDKEAIEIELAIRKKDCFWTQYFRSGYGC